MNAPEEQPWKIKKKPKPVAIVEGRPKLKIKPKKKVIVTLKTRKNDIALVESSTPKAGQHGDMMHKINEMELEIAGYKEDLKQLQIENDGLKEDILFFTKNESKLQTEIETLKRNKITDSTFYKQSEQKLKKQISALSEENKVHKENEQNYLSEIEALKKEIERLKEENPKKLKAERDKIQNEKQRLQILDDELQIKSGQMAQEIASIQQIFNDSNRRIQQIKIDFGK